MKELRVARKKKTCSHLSIGVLVNLIIPGIVIVVNKSEIFLLFSLESGWSSVYIGRKVTLGEKKTQKEYTVKSNSWNK